MGEQTGVKPVKIEEVVSALSAVIAEIARPLAKDANGRWDSTTENIDRGLKELRIPQVPQGELAKEMLLAPILKGLIGRSNDGKTSTSEMMAEIARILNSHDPKHTGGLSAEEMVAARAEMSSVPEIKDSGRRGAGTLPSR